MASGEIDITPGRVLGEEELITNQKLNDLGTPTLRIKELTITARELADGSINSDKLDVDLEAQLGVPDNSVTTNKIVDGAVTTNKLAPQIQITDPTIKPTAGAPLYRPSGLVYVNVVSAGNAVGPGTVLHSFAVPAGLLARNGDCLRLTTFIRTAANANSKTITISFGAAAAFSVTSGFNNAAIKVIVHIFRGLATTQGIEREYINGTSIQYIGLITGNENLGAPVNFNVNGIGVAANDVMADITGIEFLPAP